MSTAMRRGQLRPEEASEPAQAAVTWEQIAAAHVVYRSYPIELVSEMTYTKHSAELGDKSNKELFGAFAQLGYTMSSNITPYARYEWFERKRVDGLYDLRGAPTEHQEALAGVRISVHPKSVIKVEGSHDLLSGESEVIIQSAFAF